MKTQTLFLINLIAILAICSSCDFNDEKTYVFGETKITFDSDRGLFDVTLWNIKEISPSGGKIKYFFKDNFYPGEFAYCKISPNLREYFSSVPETCKSELMKERVEMWGEKIDSANISEIEKMFWGLKINSKKSIQDTIQYRYH